MSKHDNPIDSTVTLNTFLIYAGFQAGQQRSHICWLYSVGNVGLLLPRLARRRSPRQ